MLSLDFYRSMALFYPRIMYDLCVVGAGPVGSAIAFHASAKPGIKVCLIGPEEPKVYVMHLPEYSYSQD